MDNLSDPESAEEETDLANGSVTKVANDPSQDEETKKAIEEVVTEGDAKVELFPGDYPEEYDEYHPENRCQDDGFAPDEAEYYQREYTYKSERNGSPTQKKNKSKPMPKQNSLLLFSHTNKYDRLIFSYKTKSNLCSDLDVNATGCVTIHTLVTWSSSVSSSPASCWPPRTPSTPTRRETK